VLSYLASIEHVDIMWFIVLKLLYFSGVLSYLASIEHVDIMWFIVLKLLS